MRAHRLSIGTADFVVVSDNPGDAYFSAQASGEVPAVVHVADALLPEAPVVIDVGANLGVVALAISSIRPTGTVHAFEPGSQACKDLRASVAANHFENVRCYQDALGGHDGTAVLVAPKWDASGSFIAGDFAASALHVSNPEVQVEEVAVRTLDSYGFQHVDLIKIDVEGQEDAVLRGATQTINKCQPIVIVEFNPFTLSVFASRNPLAFVLDLMEKFSHVVALDSSLHVEPLKNASDAYGFVNRCFTSGSVVDLICSNRDLPLNSLAPSDDTHAGEGSEQALENDSANMSEGRTFRRLKIWARRALKHCSNEGERV